MAQPSSPWLNLYQIDMICVKPNPKVPQLVPTIRCVERSDKMKRRVDAALKYAGMSQSDLEEKVDFSRSTFNRRRKGDYNFNKGELHEIAEATGVPEWFLTDGWAGWRKPFNRRELEELIDSLPPDDPPGE